jgi:hypothetical protein
MKMTNEDRFWAKVDKNGPIHPRLGTPCWLWTGANNKTGPYGVFWWDGAQGYAHRYALGLKLGRPVKGVTLHACDVTLCVNFEEHITEGTQQQNVDDMVRKDRHTRGSRNGCALLQEDDVLDIRAQALAGVPQLLIALHHHISVVQVSKVARGEAWSHVAGPLAAKSNRGHSLGRDATQRVKELLQQGLSARAVARQLNLSPSTVNKTRMR